MVRFILYNLILRLCYVKALSYNASFLRLPLWSRELHGKFVKKVTCIQKILSKEVTCLLERRKTEITNKS